MNAFRDSRIEHSALGFRWLLDPKQLIDGEILNGREWEPASTAVVKRFVRAGDVVLDIGANIGYYTLLMSRIVGPTGRVVSFEPMSEPRSLVEWHIEHNAVNNAIVLPYALDDTVRNADMFFNYSWRGSSPIAQHGDMTAFRRLDDVVAELGLTQLNFIKVDVDGYEAKLLRGAVDTLRRFHPIMIIEVCEYTLRGAAGLGYLSRKDDPNYGEHVRTMLYSLQDTGYRFLWEEDLSVVENIADVTTRFDLAARSINLVCVPR